MELPVKRLSLVILSVICVQQMVNGETSKPVDSICDNRLFLTWLRAWDIELVSRNKQKWQTVRDALIQPSCLKLPLENYTCPLGGQYPPFIMRLGPVCPNGHQISKEYKRAMVLKISGPADRDDLLDAIGSKCPEVRQAATTWVGRILQDKGEAKEVVARLLKDGNPVVRILAISQVGALSRQQSLTPEFLSVVLMDQCEGVRSAAATMIGYLGGTEAKTLLLKRKNEEKDDAVLQAISSALEMEPGDGTSKASGGAFGH